MKLRVVTNETAACALAAARMAEAAAAAQTIGLAAGATMVPVYGAAADRAAEEPGLFARSRFFSLDELAGLPADDPASFAAFLHQHFLKPSGADLLKVRLLRGDAANPAAEALAYEAEIAAAGGIGLQLLGIGRNGHIAFNEPGSRPDTRTRLVSLARETREAFAGASERSQQVPKLGLTMGVGSILEARHILLVALGSAKANAVACALEGPIGPSCPASFLRLHPHAAILCDTAAASRLTSRVGRRAQRH